jgi:hypothetical protein
MSGWCAPPAARHLGPRPRDHTRLRPLATCLRPLRRPTIGTPAHRLRQLGLVESRRRSFALQQPARVRIVSIMADTPSPDQGHIVQGLRWAADNVERHLARSSGLEVGQVAILMHLDLHQPATIPDVAAAVDRGNPKVTPPGNQKTPVPSGMRVLLVGLTGLEPVTWARRMCL